MAFDPSLGPWSFGPRPAFLLGLHNRYVTLRQELLDRVRAIPHGRVTNYGALGASLSRPVSGVVVGRWLNSIPEDVPWWRVVGRDGRLPIWKKDPSLEDLQFARLEEEGVEIAAGKVHEAYFVSI